MPPKPQRWRHDPAGSWPRHWLLAAQLGGLFLVAVALGLALPGAGLGSGVAAGLLACAVAATSLAGRVAWRRLGMRHPQVGMYGAEVLAREAVRCGVTLLVVLGVVGPLSLGADRLPVWLLAALATGAAATLPAGLVVELSTLDPRRPPPDPGAGWAVAVSVAAAVGLLAALLAALAGAAELWVALRWAVAAVVGFGLGAGPRLVRRPGGHP